MKPVTILALSLAALLCAGLPASAQDGPEQPRPPAGKDTPKTERRYETRTVCGPKRRCERRRELVRVCGPVTVCQRRYVPQRVCRLERVCSREYDRIRQRYERVCRQERVCEQRTLPKRVCVTRQDCRWERKEVEDCRTVTVCRKRRVPVPDD